MEGGQNKMKETKKEKIIKFVKENFDIYYCTEGYCNKCEERILEAIKEELRK